MTTLLLLALAVPVAGAVFIALLRRNPNAREAASLVTAGALFAIVLRIYQAVSGGARPEVTLAEPLPGIRIALEAEPLGVLFALIASFLWIVTTAYSIGYMRGHHEKNQTRFYLFFAFAIASVMGVAFAGNLFTLFAFYEVLSLATFPLVTHAGTEKAKRAGRVYLGILFSTSVAGNIAYGVESAADARIREAATRSLLDRDIEELEEGLATVVGERGVTLSGGQKQRCTLARALLREPRILILDDALSAVDTQTEEAILGYLREAMRGRTTIVIAHRISTLRHADLIVTLDDGRIVESGDHESLVRAGGLYSELHERQQLSAELESL